MDRRRPVAWRRAWPGRRARPGPAGRPSRAGAGVAGCGRWPSERTGWRLRGAALFLGGAQQVQLRTHQAGAHHGHGAHLLVGDVPGEAVGHRQAHHAEAQDRADALLAAAAVDAALVGVEAHPHAPPGLGPVPQGGGLLGAHDLGAVVHDLEGRAGEQRVGGRRGGQRDEQAAPVEAAGHQRHADAPLQQRHAGRDRGGPGVVGAVPRVHLAEVRGHAHGADAQAVQQARRGVAHGVLPRAGRQVALEALDQHTVGQSAGAPAHQAAGVAEGREAAN